MYTAHYAANNEYEKFNTFEEAEKWLAERWEEDGSDEGFAEESMNGKDFIAKVTHFSKYKETANKEKDGFVWNEEAQASINSDGEEWPVAENHDSYGQVVLIEDM